MAVPKRLTDSLHHSLGDAAGADMLDWMGHTESGIDAVRADIAELRHQMDVRFAAADAKLAERLAAQSARLDDRLLAQSTRMDERLTALAARMEERFTDTIKWSFIFWATTALALVGLLVSRR